MTAGTGCVIKLGAILDAVITARVWAAGESSRDEITVRVAPPTP